MIIDRSDAIRGLDFFLLLQCVWGLSTAILAAALLAGVVRQWSAFPWVNASPLRSLVFGLLVAGAAYVASRWIRRERLGK